MPYPHILGGVTAINTRQFIELNGYANKFFNWGGEDDDLYNRSVNDAMSWLLPTLRRVAEKNPPIELSKSYRCLWIT